MSEPREGTTEEFEQLPVPTGPAKKTSPWIPTLDKIKQGKVMFIPYSSRSKLKGIRIGLARLAASDKLKLEFRANAQHDVGQESEAGELGVRIHPTEPYVAPTKGESASGPRRSPGRPRKEDHASTRP